MKDLLATFEAIQRFARSLPVMDPVMAAYGRQIADSLGPSRELIEFAKAMAPITLTPPPPLPFIGPPPRRVPPAPPVLVIRIERSDGN